MISLSPGNEKWVFEAGGEANSPMVADDVLYFGGRRDEKLYAVDLNTGTERWSFDTEAFIYTSPTGVEGSVYLSNLDGLYAVDADTGTENWRSDIIGGFSSPTVADGTVYV